MELLFSPFKYQPKNVPLVTKFKRFWARKIIQESAGTIVFFRKNKQPLFLLLHRLPPLSDWTFPKGVIEDGETKKQAALRETWEEAGIKVKIAKELSPNFYIFYWDLKNEKAYKTVYYFLAESKAKITDFTQNPDKDEHAQFDKAIWVKIDEAKKLVSHDKERLILDQARISLSSDYPIN